MCFTSINDCLFSSLLPSNSIGSSSLAVFSATFSSSISIFSPLSVNGQYGQSLSKFTSEKFTLSQNQATNLPTSSKAQALIIFIRITPPLHSPPLPSPLPTHTHTHQGLVHEKLMSANPGLKFCSIFEFTYLNVSERNILCCHYCISNLNVKYVSSRYLL